MTKIIANAHILTDQGENASNLSLVLQSYSLKSRRWLQLASAKTNDVGIWKVAAAPQGESPYAPMLRVVESGAPGPRVLADGGYIRYDPRSKTLTVDFGKIERLDDAAYKLTASMSQFNRSSYYLAGQAHKPNFVPIASVLHMRDATTLSGGRITAATATTTVQPAILLDTYNAEILKFRSNEAKLKTEISQKDSLIESRDKQLETSRLQITQLNEKLAKSQEAEKRLKDENDTFKKVNQEAVPIQSIASNIGVQIDQANRKLRDENRPYTFGKIELDLRGTVSEDGQSMALANFAQFQVAKGAQFASVKAEIIPIRPGSKDTSGDITVPDVTGFTESVVRRLLHAVGLKLEPVNKTLPPASDIPAGQSIQQSPKAGTQVTRNSAVIVVFTAPAANMENET